MQYIIYKEDRIELDNLLDVVENGDLILFKSLENLNSTYIGNYYTHIGIIIRYDIPMLFEINGFHQYEELKSEVTLTPLKDRLLNYRGLVYVKFCKKNVDILILDYFKKIFIPYAKNNFRYNKNVLVNGLKKGLGMEKINKQINCAELVLISLIILEIISKDIADMQIFHSLKYCCNLDSHTIPYYIYIKQFKTYTSH